MTSRFPPEGKLLHTIENQALCATAEGLEQAMNAGTVLEGQALLCDEHHDLIVRFGPFTGCIPREEAALGIAEGTTRDIAILSRVGKPVCFTIEGLEGQDGALVPRLSRRRAQEQALAHIMANWVPGQVVPATVTHLEPFGAFVDIGCGVPSMIGVERLSVSRIPHTGVRLAPGQDILAAVLEVDRALGRVVLTHRELLGTWEENATLFRPGMTAVGWARGVKDYGIFVELTANLSGLAEPREGVQEGDRLSVYIKSILPDRMKLKLIVIDVLPPDESPQPLHYFITEGVIDRWQYAPPGCQKAGGETLFTSE